MGGEFNVLKVEINDGVIRVFCVVDVVEVVVEVEIEDDGDCVGKVEVI